MSCELTTKILAELTEENFEELSVLYEDLMPEIEHTAEQIKELFANLSETDNHYLIGVMDGEKIAGTALAICCQSLSMGGKNFLVLEDVVVSPSYRKRGVGKKLMEKADELAKQMNCEYSMLASSDFRKGAHKFYEACGFNDPVRGFRKLY